MVEMATEKAQQAVLKGVEDFDPSVLKHAETQEKVVLPDAEGNVNKVNALITCIRNVTNIAFLTDGFPDNRFMLKKFFSTINCWCYSQPNQFEFKVADFSFLSCTLFFYPASYYLRAAVQQEKTQQNLLHGVESFDKSALKPTDTVEKIILPATEGNN